MENIFELNLPKTFAVDPNEFDDNQSKPKDGSSNLDPDTEVETDAENKKSSVNDDNEEQIIKSANIKAEKAKK